MGKDYVFFTKGCKLKTLSLRHYVNNQTMINNHYCASDAISNNLQLISGLGGINQLSMLSGVSQNWCAVSVRLVGVLGWQILRGNSKTCFIGFELSRQTVLWLADVPHSTPILTDGALNFRCDGYWYCDICVFFAKKAPNSLELRTLIF